MKFLLSGKRKVLSKAKILLISVFSLIAIALVTVFLWQKPKIEKLAKQYVESMGQKKSVPIKISIEKTNISLFPPQLEIFNASISPKGDLKKTLKPFQVEKIAIQPSLLDLLIGKFWISHLELMRSKITLNINTSSKKKEKNDDFDFNKILQQIPISQISLDKFETHINIDEKYFIQTEALKLKAFNKKSSLIITAKEPSLFLKKGNDTKGIKFLLDSQLMLTEKSLSLSKLKIVKDSSFFLASGNVIFKDNFKKIKELQIGTRIKSSFTDLHTWSNQLYKNNHLKDFKGSFKTDINISNTDGDENFSANIDGSFKSFQIEKVILGDFDIKANLPNKDEINIPQISLTLSGNNKALIKDAKIIIGKKTTFEADVSVHKTQLHSFLKDSTIANIPVWLQISGNMKCKGHYENQLHIECPGSVTAEHLKVQNASRSKDIVKAKKIDIEGVAVITEKFIKYVASANMEVSKVKSEGTISFKDGFNINYDSEFLDLTEIGPIADLKFVGTGSAKGSTQGNSKAATFAMDIKANSFEFGDYYFGGIKSNLSYRTGSIYLKSLSGDLESTRFNGHLQVNLDKELITGDLQLPFFRMEDIQQAVIKKVDLKNRFLGSGSGRVSIATPFESDRMTFSLDARLFKGTAFGEDYNEAKLQAVATEGQINIKKFHLLKEKSAFQMKGKLDTKLNTELFFDIASGHLQHSTLLHKYNLPISGSFIATGKITGKIDSPNISTKAKVEELIFNKKNYGSAIFSYSNADKQTSLQFNLPDRLDLLILLPEKDSSSFFIDLDAKKVDIAPIIGFLITQDSTRSYLIETTGEISGHIDTADFWNSEFSSTIEEIAIDYKSNKITSSIPTNIELKNHKLFLNELSIKGPKQYIKILQKETQPYRTSFIINGMMNISFFKLFAPFIEKIDGFSSLRLELSLNRNDIELFGSSYTTNSFLKFPGFPHAFEELTADLSFNQNKVLINSITGQFAGGKILGNGKIQFQGPKKYNLVINTDFEDAQIHFPEGIHTNGSGSISLSGSGTPFKLAGNYRVKQGLIEKELESSEKSASKNLLEDLLKEEVSTPMLLDIDIIAENSIEVRNSLLEGYVNGNLNVYDKIDQPRITGNAKFEKGSIIKMRENEFEVTDSTIQFMGRNPIDPNLFLRAETRLNSYDINLLFQRRAGKQQLQLSSQPPLAEQQIISMLALGQLPDQLEQEFNSQQQAAGSSFQIGTSLLSNNPLGKEIKDRLGVDIQFSSSFDDQNNVAVPKVTISKKMGRDLELSMSQTTGNASQSEGKMTYELNEKLSTIFKITNRAVDTTKSGNVSGNNQSNPFGVDLEYKVEFD